MTTRPDWMHEGAEILKVAGGSWGGTSASKQKITRVLKQYVELDDGSKFNNDGWERGKEWARNHIQKLDSPVAKSILARSELASAAGMVDTAHARWHKNGTAIEARRLREALDKWLVAKEALG